MAQEMRGHSFRSFAAAHFAPIKDYLVHRDPLSTHHHHPHPHPHHVSTEVGHAEADARKHSRIHFSSHRTKRSYSDSDAATSNERVVLLPGWVSRRYRAGPELSNRAGAPYDIEVFVSGYVVKHRVSSVLSRPQRTFLRLARRFAALPKLPDLYHDDSEDSLPPETDESAEDLLSTTIPLLPDEAIEECSGHVLLQSPKVIAADLSSTRSCPVSISVSAAPNPRELPPAPHPKPSCPGTDGLPLHRLHSNLAARLLPFWATVLPNRSVRVSVCPHVDAAEGKAESASPGERELFERPLAAHEVVTDPEGAFKIRFAIPWESLCTHPRGPAVAFVDPHCEHDFSVTAELMPPLPPSPTESRPRAASSPIPPVPTATTVERVPLTYSPVRVISDIDDTVKLSGILCGARAVFHNVFVKNLEDNLIPGMGEWYSEMWRKGVRFHYVSNGPFELLPVINEFFLLAKLPTGSVRLRSYGTRTLFSGLLSAPSDRKRDGVLEVLTSFPHSRFILIGDSGEQDLELYATIARDHPEQILCIFIRDANTYEDGGEGIKDPTGIRAPEGDRKRGSWGMSLSRGRWSLSSSSLSSSPGVSRAPSDSTGDNISRTPSSASSVQSVQRPFTDMVYAEPTSYDNVPQSGTLTPRLTHRFSLSESDKKREDLQARLWRVCAEVPSNVVIRVFRDPRECVEASQVIDPYLTREAT